MIVTYAAWQKDLFSLVPESLRAKAWRHSIILALLGCGLVAWGLASFLIVERVPTSAVAAVMNVLWLISAAFHYYLAYAIGYVMSHLAFEGRSTQPSFYATPVGSSRMIAALLSIVAVAVLLPVALISAVSVISWTVLSPTPAVEFSAYFRAAESVVFLLRLVAFALFGGVFCILGRQSGWKAYLPHALGAYALLGFVAGLHLIAGLRTGYPLWEQQLVEPAAFHGLGLACMLVALAVIGGASWAAHSAFKHGRATRLAGSTLAALPLLGAAVVLLLVILAKHIGGPGALSEIIYNPLVLLLNSIQELIIFSSGLSWMDSLAFRPALDGSLRYSVVSITAALAASSAVMLAVCAACYAVCWQALEWARRPQE